MRKLALFIITVVFITTSCGPAAYQGSSVGAAGGATAGALIDKNNRWRGAVIGGVLGAVIGGTITEIATRSAREAAINNRPVEYRSEDGRERVYANPIHSDEKCKLVKVRYYSNNELVMIEEKRVCY